MNINYKQEYNMVHNIMENIDTIIERHYQSPSRYPKDAVESYYAGVYDTLQSLHLDCVRDAELEEMDEQFWLLTNYFRLWERGERMAKWWEQG
jgi:hypothetical protein